MTVWEKRVELQTSAECVRVTTTTTTTTTTNNNNNNRGAICKEERRRRGLVQIEAAYKAEYLNTNYKKDQFVNIGINQESTQPNMNSIIKTA